MHMAVCENMEQESMCVLVTAAHSNKNMRGYLLLGGGYHTASLEEMKSVVSFITTEGTVPVKVRSLAVALTTLR